MRFILAGEGSSDLGSKDDQGGFRKGAMTHIIDAIALKHHDCSPEYEYLADVEVQRLKKKNPRLLGNRGREAKPHTEIYLSALSLGEEANRKAKNKGEDWGVVFFKDTDGTRSASPNLWESKVRAMQSGFDSSRNPYGIPMVPKPKSEAWLLGYYQKGLPEQRAYNHCERFEEMSGNDASPNSLKKLLQKALKTKGNVYELITEGKLRSVDWEEIDMPSFNLFRKRLENVLAEMNGQPPPHPVEETRVPEG
ncbi:MAG: hypothetical protein ACOX2U_02420 [Limisphaerales bacterium]|jgi:hypothetical protein|nr:hypothetical protein [Verrucomicrobiota bacterium]